MKSAISRDIDVKITEMKNFVATFSSKNIEVGQNFEIDFANGASSLKVQNSTFIGPNIALVEDSDGFLIEKPSKRAC